MHFCQGASRALRAPLLLVPLTASVLSPAVIVVEGDCTLADAIVAANTDAPVGGCSTGFGADEIRLTADVTLTEILVSDDRGMTGLPTVATEVTIQGGGFEISREPDAPSFRIFFVDANGSLTLTNTTVSGGRADEDYFSFEADDGGGILNYGRLTLEHSTVSGNAAGRYNTGEGGGIFNGGRLWLRYSSVAANSAYSYFRGGGGIYNAGSALIIGSTISENAADETTYYAGGGAIYNSGDLTLVNSTVSGNTNDAGGTIHTTDGSDFTVLVNTTVTANEIRFYSYPVLVGPATLYGSIIGSNDASFSCDEEIVDGGGNLDDDGTCGAGFGLLSGLDPTLADNGGPTPTHALLPGSSAIDAAGACGLAVDQRGFRREDGACDSGSFELGAAALAVELIGSCPGVMTASVNDATPDATIRLFKGRTEGTTTLPGGPCQGVELGLTNARPAGTLRVDANGSGSVDLDFAPLDCGSLLQALDQSVCDVSPLERIGCHELRTDGVGSGGDPVASPANSPRCPAGTYLPGEEIDLQAAPDLGWQVFAWNGTDDDSSAESSNQLTMPPADHVAAVGYEKSCYALSLGHTGSGSDPAATPIGNGADWTRQTVTEDFFSARYLETADIDGDGDPDLVVGGLSELAWMENRLRDGDSWLGHTILVGGNHFAGVADMDGDGDVDVLATEAQADAIVWWENTLGDGTAWVQHTVASDFTVPIPADIDGDGDIDVAGSAGDLHWWENTLGDGTTWVQHFVSLGSVEALGDLDGDGDVDIIGNDHELDAEFIWWENSAGDGSSWTEHLVVGMGPQASSAFATDVDRDGDLDVLTTGGDEVAWWENDLAGEGPWIEHKVSWFSEAAHSARGADLDGDGDTDLLTVAITIDDVYWWENLDGETWFQHTLASDFDRAFGVRAADFDGDGDPDLAGIAEGASIDWWENRYASTCASGSFQFADRLALTAVPDPGWQVAGWTGTDDDASTDVDNTATMPAADHSITVDYVTSGPALSITGSCPGEATFMVTTPEAGQRVSLYRGPAEGMSVVPLGPCAGTELGITDPRFFARLTTDANGSASLTRTLPDGVCGQHWQAVQQTCATSPVVEFP